MRSCTRSPVRVGEAVAAGMDGGRDGGASTLAVLQMEVSRPCQAKPHISRAPLTWAFSSSSSSRNRGRYNDGWPSPHSALLPAAGEGEDKYLIATSEQTLCAMHRKDWFDKPQVGGWDWVGGSGGRLGPRSAAGPPQPGEARGGSAASQHPPHTASSPLLSSPLLTEPPPLLPTLPLVLQLPIKYVGYSTCFRKEAGSHGRDTLGIFRCGCTWAGVVCVMGGLPGDDCRLMYCDVCEAGPPPRPSLPPPARHAMQRAPV